MRIGIDVGGTFTHAVAIDSADHALLGRVKVPTTHSAAQGVAGGVVQSLLRLLDECRVSPDEVLLIAHSTTQATNALLEGDVAPVGILGMGRGLSAALARAQTRFGEIRLTARQRLRTAHAFVRSDRADAGTIDTAIDALARAGAKVIVAAEAFSVDDSRLEELVCERAMLRGLPGTATHHVSRLHGLRTRTRTAAINASMIPRMLATANMTEKAVREAGIRAPLMIMRSDGGIMSIDEMRRRPILTMLSGPAAGVAAALLYARISDGVFLEVGGTSTDISVIKNGRCQVRSAEIGGQKLHVSTLDVRTVGVAGGSLAAVEHNSLVSVGPRSAHIAGLQYLSFASGVPQCADESTVEFDSAHYLAIRTEAETLAVTPTCAANLLGDVPDGDPARGEPGTIAAGFRALAELRTRSDEGREIAAEIQRLVVRGVAPLIEQLMCDYRLDRGVVRLVGGGGGASAIVPATARAMGVPFENAPNADVISAIGAALALVRDSVERTVIAPTDDDIRLIRREAMESVLRMGAAAETIEVFVEVDSRNNLIRAVAEGATEIRRSERPHHRLGEQDQETLVRASFGRAATGVSRTCTVAGFAVWEARCESRGLLSFGRRERNLVRVLDDTGTIRWQSSHAACRTSTSAAAVADLESLAERYTRYSDAGATIPHCFVLLAGRVINLSGLLEMKQVIDVLRMELSRVGANDACVLLVEPPP